MRTAVVTGGTRGIGKEVVAQLVKQGYKVAVISASGAFVAGASSHKCNVADFGEVKQVADKIMSELGGVDVLVNNAGITRDNLALMMKEQEFDEVVEVNLKGAFNCSKHFMKALMKSPSSLYPEDHIAQVFERGYKLKDKVIKHARVIVSSGAEA